MIHHKLLHSVYHPEIWVILTTVGYKVVVLCSLVRLALEYAVEVWHTGQWTEPHDRTPAGQGPYSQRNLLGGSLAWCLSKSFGLAKQGMKCNSCKQELNSQTKTQPSKRLLLIKSQEIVTIEIHGNYKQICVTMMSLGHIVTSIDHIVTQLFWLWCHYIK